MQRLFFRCRGTTRTDTLTATAALAMLMALALPALSQSREDSRVTQCANNLRLLATAAHLYADDFNGSFFYHWPGNAPGEDAKPRGLWSDEQRVGRYLVGEPVGGPPGYPGPYLDQTPMGLGGRAFICPSDQPGALRSYEMNFWASGVDEPGTEFRDTYPQHGQLFDRNAQHLDRLLLFSEAFSSTRVREGWVPPSLFGMRYYPGERFGKHGVPLDGRAQARFRAPVIPQSYLDYSRHAPGARPGGNEGAVNIAYADGHVALRQHTDLYEPATGLSTYTTLWSPVDREIEQHREADR